jgi:phosphoribosylformylglycinamidine (FGAM) synthase-like enzyme
VSNNSAQPTRTPQPTRTTAQIEADLGATRDRLAASVEALIDQVHPNRIKQRQIANLKRFANTELENAKLKIFTARGDLRTGRIATIVAAVAGIVGFLLIIRSIVQRGKSDE